MCNFPDCHQPVARDNKYGMCIDHTRVRVLSSYHPDEEVDEE